MRQDGVQGEIKWRPKCYKHIVSWLLYATIWPHCFMIRFTREMKNGINWALSVVFLVSCSRHIRRAIFHFYRIQSCPLIFGMSNLNRKNWKLKQMAVQISDDMLGMWRPAMISPSIIHNVLPSMFNRSFLIASYTTGGTVCPGAPPPRATWRRFAVGPPPRFIQLSREGQK